MVEVDETGDRTTVPWSASVVAKLPGTGRILEAGIRRFLRACVGGQAAYADQLGSGRASPE
ncbi:MAG TPA: hypothetical protein VFC99_18410 [Acidimicrobiia bacterium]|nr:hypothetical protein [Acidimicrobiia bacterium]